MAKSKADFQTDIFRREFVMDKINNRKRHRLVIFSMLVWHGMDKSMMGSRRVVKSLIPAITLLFVPLVFSQTYSTILTGQGNTNNGQNALQVVALGTDGFAYLPVWQDASGTWHQTGALPKLTINGQAKTFSALATARGNGLGKLQVIGLGTGDGAAYVAAFQDLNGNWYPGGPLPSFGAPYTQLFAMAGTCTSHPLQVIGLGSADRLAHLVAFQDTSGNWTGSQAVFGNLQFSAISVGYGNQGNLQIFGLGASDGKPHLAAFQNNANGAGDCSWTTPGSLPPVQTPSLSKLIQVNGNHGNLQVIGLGSDGLPYLPYWQDSSGTWSAAGLIPNPGVHFDLLAGAQGNSGNLQLWGLGNDSLGHMSAWQNQSGTWSGVSSVPTDNAAVTIVVMGNGNNGNVQVLGLGVNGHIDLISWQDSGSGTWNAGSDLTPGGGGGAGTGGCSRC